MGLPVACVQKIKNAMAAIRIPVLTTSNVKTENAPWRRNFQAFTLFIKRYGIESLLDCLEENEKRGILYHRKGIIGDYDDFDDVEKLIEFIKTGKR